MVSAFRRSALPSVLVVAVLGDAPIHAQEDALKLGKKIFTEIAQPGCPICHALADAGATGNVGPSLDSLQPDAERVKAAVINGIGAMPAYEDLSEEQIDALAQYVSTVAGR